MYRISQIYIIYIGIYIIYSIIRGRAHKSNTHAAAKLFRWKAFMIDEPFAAERKSLVPVGAKSLVYRQPTESFNQKFVRPLELIFFYNFLMILLDVIV